MHSVIQVQEGGALAGSPTLNRVVLELIAVVANQMVPPGGALLDVERTLLALPSVHILVVPVRTSVTAGGSEQVVSRRAHTTVLV